ncbi:hypothetical protein V1512DRAFT_205236 [Lipomyces arxii]|uniref:uncharacterized protein n=1 Tax=Lipomyces arxii TaxID=56418 RepID=UPI0034CE8729
MISDHTHLTVLALVVASVVLYVFVPSLSSYNLAESETRHTVGLYNRANDCFANSVLQALSASKRLNTFLNRHYEGRNLTSALKTILDELNRTITESRSISPWPFLHVLEKVYNSRITRSQHDAHELLHLILETVDAENTESVAARSKLSSKDKEEPDTTVDVPFKGKTIDKIMCERCRAVLPARSTDFIVLTLPVPQTSSTDLQSCLSSVLGTERISDYGCQSCRLRALASRTTEPEKSKLLELDPTDELPFDIEARLPKSVTSTIFRSTGLAVLPDVLILHLSRSIYNAGATRNSCRVSYPEQLTLYTALSVALETDIRSKDYKLVALVRHKGTHSAGHYECFKRKPALNAPESTLENVQKSHKSQAKDWWQISDSKTWECTTSEVLRQSRYAYLLVYERI